MNDQLEMIPGTTRDAALSQFFTPPKLAAKLVEWASVSQHSRLGRDLPGQQGRSPYRVLEPSAGNGAIVRPLVAAGAEVVAVEFDARYQLDLEAYLRGRHGPLIANFLECTVGGLGSCDLCVGNFPFHLDLEGAFTLHALKFAPRVVAIYPANFFYTETRERLWKRVRPTRIAHIAKRPWPGATDYVALELERREFLPGIEPVKIEWWFESWS